MYAIVEIAGLQYKVEQDQQLYVNRLDANEGDSITFDRVLLTDDKGTVTVGAPVIDGLTIEAEIVKHLRGDKIIVFKKKRRKGYQVKNGHRQSLTQIKITSLAGKAAKKATSKKAAPKTAAKAIDDNKETSAALTKKTTAKKETEADDLTKIEGIGPKVKEIFKDKGIATFTDLAKQKPATLKTILEEKSGRYAGMDPDTWPKQAKLAADGKWDELKKWQDELNGGV